MENKNQPANPATIHKVKGEEVETVSFPGLSKREYFAAMAMEGLISSDMDKIKGVSLNKDNILRLVTERAVEYADELLKQLEK